MKNPRNRFTVTAFFLLAISIFFVYGIVSSSASEPSPSAKASVLYEPVNKTFIYSKNADLQLPMASTTKIMTALVAIENGNLDRIFEIPKDAIGIEGSSLYLKQGEKLSINDLLYALMLRSANDAACAIAYAVSGGVEDFAQRMNEKAAELGLTSTHFTNPHGLDDKNHYTTARELAIIAAEAMNNEVFKEIVSTKKTIIENTDGEKRLLTNHNKLLSLYDGACGIKTGFTKRCGRCLVGAAERDGLRFITVTIDAPDDWRDHTSLFNYGFSLYECRILAEPNDYEYKIPVLNSETASVTVANSEEFKIITMKGSPKIEKRVELNSYAVAPIKSADALGRVVFTMDGVTVGEIKLYAKNDCSLKESKGFFKLFNK